MSDERNVFRISRVTNQAKKNIAINNYPNTALIQQYLAYTIQAYGGTVERSLRSLVTDMRNRQSQYPTLTRAFGTRIANIMGW